MADKSFYSGTCVGPEGSVVDVYAAFSDIFGVEPPPGRLPTYRVPVAVPSNTAGLVHRVSQMNLHANNGKTLFGAASMDEISRVSTHSSANSASGAQSVMYKPKTDGSQPSSQPSRSVSLLSLTSLQESNGAKGPTRSMSQVWTGIKNQVATPRAASASSFHVPLTRGSDQRTMSLYSTTRGGRPIPRRAADTFGVSHNAQQNTTDGSREDSRSAGHAMRKASSGGLSTRSISTARSTIVTTRKEPLVYPAMLSKVADKFCERIQPGDRVKNDLAYKQAFTGAEAVQVISDIIKTPDRNLALLLGRALDAQKLFHDVTYDNRLRDSMTEVYQLSSIDSGKQNDPRAPPKQQVNGIFTLLTECYSPTCTRDKLCYSIACPRRLEQQARLNMKLDPGLKNYDSGPSLQVEDEKELWINTVPPETVEKISKEEQKRQEVICEFIYTERDFVKDLEYLRDFWMKPLRRSNVIQPEHRREMFIRNVFQNILEIHAVNIKFAEALTKRQQQSPVVENIADVVLEYAPRFEPFVRYGAGQLYGKYEFERERNTNPAFAHFVEETERLQESRKLEINGFLSKPTTRIARYPLLLEAVLKHTSKDNQDFENLPVAVSTIRKFLVRLNAESGRTENHFALLQLNQSLLFRPGDYVDLKLTDAKRKIVYHGELQKRPNDATVMQVYLFDNAILIGKKKLAKREVLKVTNKPIPLQLLEIVEDEEFPRTTRSASSMIRGAVSRADSVNAGYPLTFQHLGRRGFLLTLYAPSEQARKTWIDVIKKQCEESSLSGDVYTQHVLQDSFFGANRRVTCAESFDGGRKMLYGTAQGLYLSELSYAIGESHMPISSEPELVVQMAGVSQVDVLDKYGLVLFLAGKVIYSLPLETLTAPIDPIANGRRAKHIVSQATFYKADECGGRTLLSVIKSNAVSASFRLLEPAEPVRSVHKRPPLRRFLSGQQPVQHDPFNIVRDATEIPSATYTLTYLKRHLCLGCARGFELLDLDTMKIESLLDPADTSLDFVIRKDSLKPLSLYRINKEFLLNYSEFSFFINGNGWRSRPDWIIHWEGTPHQIVLSYPYLIAFDSSFIEIRDMDRELLRIIPSENIRFLHESASDLVYVHENEAGHDEVVSINFWEKQQKKQKSKTFS